MTRGRWGSLVVLGLWAAGCGGSSSSTHLTGAAGHDGAAGNGAAAGNGGGGNAAAGNGGAPVGGNGEAAGNGGAAGGAAGNGGGLGGAGGQEVSGTGGPGEGGHDAGIDGPACVCLQQGNWQIDNLEPCFFFDTSQTNVTGAVSTVDEGSGQFSCPTDDTTAPTGSWSADRLTSDCLGQYTLCYALKAGDPQSPQPTDCVVAQSCTTGDITTVNQAQTFPPLPSWLADSTEITCANAFEAKGGYGEITITAMPTGCGATLTKSYVASIYCPLSCSTSASCTCTPGGSGAF